jgi:hypothetical protein
MQRSRAKIVVSATTKKEKFYSLNVRGQRRAATDARHARGAYRRVRSPTRCWATAYARTLARRTATVLAEAKGWCNEVRPALADNREGVRAEAIVLESALLREREQQRLPKPNMVAECRRTKPQERRGTVR